MFFFSSYSKSHCPFSLARRFMDLFATLRNPIPLCGIRLDGSEATSIRIVVAVGDRRLGPLPSQVTLQVHSRVPVT